MLNLISQRTETQFAPLPLPILLIFQTPKEILRPLGKRRELQAYGICDQ